MLAATTLIIKMLAEEIKLIMIHLGLIDPFKLLPEGIPFGKKPIKTTTFLSDTHKLFIIQEGHQPLLRFQPDSIQNMMGQL